VVVVVLVRRADDDRASGRIEEQRVGAEVVAMILIEVEQVHDRSRGGVERAAAETLAVQPVVFDEPHHGSLRDVIAAHVVGLGIGRDHDEGNARTRTAATVHRLAIEPVRRRLLADAETALARTVDLIGGRIIRGALRREVLVIIPTVGVVIGDDDGSFAPFRLLLQEVDQLDIAGLLVERVGIAGVTVLIGRHLDVETAGR